MSRIVVALVALMLTTASASAYAPAQRIRCAVGKYTIADWQVRTGRYRIKLDGEWSSVPRDAVGPLFVLLVFGGAGCTYLAPPARSR